MIANCKLVPQPLVLAAHAAAVHGLQVQACIPANILNTEVLALWRKMTRLQLPVITLLVNYAAAAVSVV